MKDAESRSHEFVVEESELVDEAGGTARLDALLARRLPDLSRSRIAQLLKDGRVRLNDAVPKKSVRPVAGDRVLVELPAPEPSRILSEEIPLDIVYQDDDLLVIDKPVGLVVHPAPGHRSGTLVNALLHHVKDLSGIGGVQRPGIIHRLDKDTSGLMLVAKNDAAHRALSAALKRRDIERRYLVAVWGHLKEDRFTVEAPIGRSPTHRTRMAVVPDGRPAVTHLRRLERWRAVELFQATLESGRTHQIRVHMAAIGHPVVGDAAYAPRAAWGMSGPDLPWAREFARRVPRQFLHAAELSFVHPRTGERMEFSRPLPPDLEAAATWARNTVRSTSGS